MSKESEFKIKEEQQRLVESEPELKLEGNVNSGSQDGRAHGADECGPELSSEPLEAARRKEESSANSGQPPENKVFAQKKSPPKASKPPKNRPATGVMVLTLGCVFAGVLAFGASGIHIGRAGLRAQIGALFGSSSEPGIDSSMDLVQALYHQCALDVRHHKKPPLDALDAALEHSVKAMEAASSKSTENTENNMRFGLLKLRQSVSAVWRRDKALAATRAEEAMNFIPKEPPAQMKSVPHTLKDAMADTGIRLTNAGVFDAAMPILEARIAYKSQALELLPPVREALGECYQAKGDYKNAFACYERAFEDAKGPCGGHDPVGMRRMGLMGVVKAKMHEYKEATGYFHQAFDYFKSTDGRLRFVADYADAQMALGNYDDARKLLEDSMKDLSQTASRRGYYTKALMSMARYYQHENQLSEAEKYFELAMKEVAKGSPSPPLDELTQLRNSFGAK